MTEHKHIGKIVGALMAAAVAFCLIVTLFADRFVAVSGSSAATMEYKSTLFDTSEIMTVNIIMDEDQWQELLDNAISEKYYACDVEINGETISNVGIRTKGNTSLSSIANDPDTDRYSFKIKFDKYVDGQTCMGLDKLVLNNNFADATNRKEALVYDMFQYLGADASLYHYAKISVNGEYWGTYLALEAVEDSFKLRNYGVSDGKLYKPETMGMGNDQKEEGEKQDGKFDGNSLQRPDNADFPSSEEGDLAKNSNSMDRPERPQGDFDQAGMDEKFKDPQGGSGDFGNRNGGADLNYTDDDVDSYSTIWDGADGKVTDSDKERVVNAIKNINEGTDLTAYLDIDNILKYMAVHEFVVNLDSLTGNMPHNYYLYEKDSELNIIPWDYNLSYGGFQSGSADDVITFPIDTPFSESISLEDRQFFMALLNNETYLAQYHEYLSQLVEYVQNGKLDAVYDRITSQIDNLVKTDPTAFYTYDEYTAAKEMLKENMTIEMIMKFTKLKKEEIEKLK